jgi:NAD(P)-dependent dehydrogenase (short-subunit alcohol dehydrogenase family)
MVQQSRTDIAIVTGAAGGMGAPSATRLAALGWPLLLCDLDAARLERVAAPLRAEGASVEIFAGDLADTDYAARLIAALGDRAVGVLIHTAGLSPTMAPPARVMAVNFTATSRLVAALCPKMAEGGCAVLISSMSAYMVPFLEIDAAIRGVRAGDDAGALQAWAEDTNMAYPVSKRAVMALARNEAAAFGARKARIVTISPGLIDTGMGRVEMDAHPQMKDVLARTPLQRQGLGDEIASAAVMLCSPDASYITGCDIRVDGGSTAALGV